MILAWLLLLTGLIISAVAIYYSVVGLTAIFSAAVIPIIVMGASLEVAKLVCASWLKANWERAPRFIKLYMTTAVIVLMLITSMGIFGFLSKAHNDQNLVSGDVTAKLAIFDEKIKVEKDTISTNRKALAQLDSSVDQIMSRSTDEKGASKASALRQSQTKERARLLAEIDKSNKAISALNEQRAPIAAENRKVEAEVGPIKYIAKFIYGDAAADENMLEKAVTWIIVLIVIVFDPLAVIMLLGAQMTFAWKKEQEEDEPLLHKTVPLYVADVGEKPTEEEKVSEPKEEIKYQFVEEFHEPDHATPVTAPGGDITAPEDSEIDKWNKMIEEAEKEAAQEAEKKRLIEEEASKYQVTEIQYTEITGDRFKPDLTEVIEPTESKKKTYMTKDETGQLQVKNREI